MSDLAERMRGACRFALDVLAGDDPPEPGSVVDLCQRGADEIERLRKRAIENWPIVNRRRGQLIRSQIRGSLSADEEEELKRLQAYADDYIDMVCPRPSPSVEIQKGEKETSVLSKKGDEQCGGGNATRGLSAAP